MNFFQTHTSEDLTGAHVVISGGSKGIGKELAILYARRGAHITVIARNEADLARAKAEIEQSRRPESRQLIRAVSLDLTRLDSAAFPDASNSTGPHEQLLAKILGTSEAGHENETPSGRCDLLVNCCGSATPLRFEDTSWDQFEHMMRVNYFSAVHLTRCLLPVMKRTRAANNIHYNNSRVVFVSSICGLVSFYGYSAYAASKFALVGLAEALNMELRPFDIGVTVAFPPDTLTSGYEEENKMKPKLTAEMSKSGSVYTADQVARALARDISARRFQSTVGLENKLVLMASNAFMPADSLGRVLFESLIAGPLKLVAHFILRSWYALVDSQAQHEVELYEQFSKKSR